MPVRPGFFAASFAAALLLSTNGGALGQIPSSNAQSDARCAMPVGSAEALVFLVHAKTTDSLSTVALGTQNRLTYTTKVEIEPGRAPLYLILNAEEPAIWRLTGAVERIERLILTYDNGINDGSPVLTGATGVPKERVTIPGRRYCTPYFWMAPSTQASLAAEALASITGRFPSQTIVGAMFVSLALPSGKLEHLREGDPRPPVTVGSTVQTALTAVLRGQHPGGIVEIDPTAVVSHVTAARYDVLPREAGMLQLLESGALVLKGSNIQITRKIRFPLGFQGHGFTYVLERGVPPPDGDWNDAKVVDEESGQPLSRPKR